jgi:hypothetical protein
MSNTSQAPQAPKSHTSKTSKSSKLYAVVALITLEKNGVFVENKVEHLLQSYKRVSTIGSVARKMKEEVRAHRAEVTVYTDARLTEASLVKTFTV